jgi:hypothetical protein
MIAVPSMLTSPLVVIARGEPSVVNSELPVMVSVLIFAAVFKITCKPLIITLSHVPGTPFGVQFVAVFQLPPDAPEYVLVTPAANRVTVVEEVVEQPPASVTVTVYVVVEIGVAVGLAIDDDDKLVVGFQLYV